MLQVDRQNHVEDLLAQVDQAPPSHLYAQLRRLGIGARFRKGTARALPMMKKEDGTYVESYEESQEEWRKHASALEGGQQITGPDLLQQCVKRQQLQLQHGSAPHAINLPTRIQVERACRRIKPFKARGPDGLPAGLYHHFPAMMASLLHPLMLKMSCLGTEPLGFKGGRLVHLYKGKGPADEPSNRRGILISNHASKVAHGSLRGQYTPFLEAAMLPMQVGGRPHKSVQQGAHALRLFMDLCRQRNLACGVIFLDIRTAYYKVLRELVTKIHHPAERLSALIDAFNLPPSSLQELEKKLTDEVPIAGKCGVNKYMEEMLGELHSDTWFTTAGLEGLTVTAIGTRPGSCFADVFFNFLFSAVLQEIKEQLAELEILTELQWDGQRGLQLSGDEGSESVVVAETAWADDLALFFQHQDPNQLISNLQDGCTVMINTCLKYGLEPNFAKGKTEAVVALRGRGAVKARRHWFTDQRGQLPLQACAITGCYIQMVARYKHLGGVVDAKAGSKAEIQARLGQARQAFQKYKKSLFKAKAISQTKRAQLLRPFVLSILEYNLGTLTRVQPADEQKISTALLRMYKSICTELGPDDEKHKISWPRLCYALQVPSPQSLLRMAQLRYFRQIYQYGNDSLWALVQTQGQWLSSCQDAFAWMYQQIAGTTQLPDPMEHWEPWHDLLTQRPKRFAGLIQRCWKHENVQSYNDYVVNEGYSGFAIAMEVANYNFPEVVTDQVAQVPQSDNVHACLKCKRIFGSRTAWASHAFKKHKRVNQARRYAAGTCCLACGHEFWEYKRLLHHLCYSKRCRQRLAMANFEVEIEPGIGSREQRKQPEEILQPWALTPVVGLPIHDYWAGIGAAWDEELLTQLFHELPLSDEQVHLTVDDLMDKLRDVLLEATVEYSVVCATIQCWKDSMMDIAIQSGVRRAGLIRAFFLVLGRQDLVHWLLPTQRQERNVLKIPGAEWRSLLDGDLALLYIVDGQASGHDPNGIAQCLSFTTSVDGEGPAIYNPTWRRCNALEEWTSSSSALTSFSEMVLTWHVKPHRRSGSNGWPSATS